VEANLHREPLLPALRTGELCDPSTSRSRMYVLSVLTMCLSSCSFDCDAADRPGNERAAMPERSEHVSGLRRYGEAPGRVRHQQAGGQECRRPRDPAQRRSQNCPVVANKTDQWRTGDLPSLTSIAQRHPRAERPSRID
jgi:hypothetical protein